MRRETMEGRFCYTNKIMSTYFVCVFVRQKIHFRVMRLGWMYVSMSVVGQFGRGNPNFSHDGKHYLSLFLRQALLLHLFTHTFNNGLNVQNFYRFSNTHLHTKFMCLTVWIVWKILYMSYLGIGTNDFDLETYKHILFADSVYDVAFA